MTKYGLNLALKLVIAREFYDEGVQKLYELIEQKKPAYRKIFEELSDELKEKWFQRADSNFMWMNGIKNYESLNESERYEIIKEARITNEAFLEADYELRNHWFEYEYRIPFVGSWGRMPSAQPFHGWLHIGSTTASYVDFWIGTGFLEVKEKNGIFEYHETILSKSQIKMLTGKISYLDNLDLKLKNISSNFNKIPTFTKNF